MNKIKAMKQKAKNVKKLLILRQQKLIKTVCSRLNNREKDYTLVDRVPGCIFSDQPKSQPYFNVSLDDCVGHIYIGFRSSGWNPFSEAVKHYLKTKQWALLQRWYDRFQPTSLSELYFCKNDPFFGVLNEASPFLRLKPWRETELLMSGHRGGGNQNFGPVDSEKFNKECSRYETVIRSYALHGYDISIGGPITGYFLIKNSGEYVFRVTAGMHRLIVADALGWNTIPACFDEAMPRYIHENTAPLWPQVENGVIPLELAQFMFQQHFDDRGQAKLGIFA